LRGSCTISSEAIPSYRSTIAQQLHFSKAPARRLLACRKNQICNYSDSIMLSIAMAQRGSTTCSRTLLNRSISVAKTKRGSTVRTKALVSWSTSIGLSGALEWRMSDRGWRLWWHAAAMIAPDAFQCIQGPAESKHKAVADRHKDAAGGLGGKPLIWLCLFLSSAFRDLQRANTKQLQTDT